MVVNRTIRKPAVAGQFYPASASKLRQMIEKIDRTIDDEMSNFPGEIPILGGIVPHAGYQYSARQAIPFFKLVSSMKNDIETVVILNPNHHGFGSGPANLSGYQFWSTPLGNLSVDLELSDQIGLAICPEAHDHEHSGEVQLPFLQYYLSEGFRIVMITINDQSWSSCAHLARQIWQAVMSTGRRILLIASSDFSHYETPEEGARRDQLVIDEIMNFNPAGVGDVVKKHRVSVCGYGPIMTLMEFALLMVPKPSARLIKRGHSGEVYLSDNVVDYVSILFFDSSLL